VHSVISASFEHNDDRLIPMRHDVAEELNRFRLVIEGA
jgi:hypothetical protein